LGLLLSLKAYSPNWPRFITNELHRFVTILTLVFIGIHTLAVLVDPFTGFTLAEVLVPLQAHYRPLWIALGIVSGYLAIAVWASEYVRKRIGYAWWRRFHYLAFAVFLLGAAHGLGTGSDSQTWWGLAIYAVTIGSVALLIGWRLVRSLGAESRNVVFATIGAAVAAAALFTLVGPAQAGWNQIANNGNGNGASPSWLADHPATTAAAVVAAPATPFTAQFDVVQVDDDRLTGQFSSDGASGQMQLIIERGSAGVALAFADGWSCSGQLASASRETLRASCVGSDGASIEVTLGDLRRSGADIIGRLQVSTG